MSIHHDDGKSQKEGRKEEKRSYWLRERERARGPVRIAVEREREHGGWYGTIREGKWWRKQPGSAQRERERESRMNVDSLLLTLPASPAFVRSTQKGGKSFCHCFLKGPARDNISTWAFLNLNKYLTMFFLFLLSSPSSCFIPKIQGKNVANLHASMFVIKAEISSTTENKKF